MQRKCVKRRLNSRNGWYNALERLLHWKLSFSKLSTYCYDTDIPHHSYDMRCFLWNHIRLQLKGQSGTLDFNHAEGTLSLNVQKDNRDTQSQISNVKLLSGGERSYTTLALLLSLGDSLECPFRIMDEFDVFMDSVSRKVSILFEGELLPWNHFLPRSTAC